MVINRIGPMSCAKVAGTLYAILGIVFGGIFSLMGLAGAFGSDAWPAGGIAAIFGVAAIVILPVLYGGIGFVAMLVAASLYNVVAGVVGGIEVDLGESPRNR